MRRKRSHITDEIMSDYYRELRWKERLGNIKKEEQDKKIEKNINNTR